jgi:hypothetical protein
MTASAPDVLNFSIATEAIKGITVILLLSILQDIFQDYGTGSYNFYPFFYD